nr:DUF4430 domain-containing protein [uncultured Methanolobus sp.]
MKIQKIFNIAIIAFLCAIMMGVASATPTTVFDGAVTLADDTFTFVPTNNASNSYDIDSLTDLGALVAASDAGSFTYGVSDEWYADYGSFYLTDINGIEDNYTASTAWFIYVNDVLASNGLGLNDVVSGDDVTFLYAPYVYDENWDVTVDTANAEYIVDITVNEGSSATVIFDGTVTLADDTFTFVPTNNASNSYAIDSLTDLGALVAASDAGSFTYGVSDEWYADYGSFYLTDINGIEDNYTASTAWFIYVNDVLASNGLGLNDVVSGDDVTFLYAPYVYDENWDVTVDTANAEYIVDITVNEGSSATVIFDGTVTLADDTFTFVPTNNASNSYAIDSLTDLGALVAASDAGSFTYGVSDEWYADYGSFYLTDINGIEDNYTASTAWFIYVNDVLASNGLGLNDVASGDDVTFLYAPYVYDENWDVTVDTANAEYIVDITVNEGSSATVIFDGTVTLADDTFTFVPTNNASNSYAIDSLTDLGALVAASDAGSFTYGVSDEWYADYGSFYLTDINGIEDNYTASTAWFIYVNDVLASNGLGLNDVAFGDDVTFLYAPYVYDENWDVTVDTANAEYIVNITVEEVVEPTIIYDGTVTLEEGTFTFIPSNNASNSYQIEVLTDLGALVAASDAGSFTYGVSDEWYADYGSFYLTDINGIEDDYSASTAWFIYINDELAPLGLSQNIVADGDNLTFLYASYEYDENWNVIVDTENPVYVVGINVVVEVANAIDSINDLKEYINSLDAPDCTKCILNIRLDGVIYSLEHDRNQMAIIKLQSFKIAVERHESWGNLTSEEADYIIGEANDIIEIIQNS